MKSAAIALFVAVAILTAPRAGAMAESAAAVSDNAVPIGYVPLLEKYLVARPELASDPQFVEDYAKFMRCQDWRSVHENEFKYRDFLTQVKGQFEASIARPPASLFKLRTLSSFGQYEFQNKQFPFHPLPDGAAFAFDFGFKPGALMLDSNCRPTDQHWPAKIFVTIANPWVIDGLPMATDVAQRLVERNPALYQRQFGVNLVLKVEKIGDIKLDPARSPPPGFVEAEGEIVSASVDDGANQSPKMIFVADEAYLRDRNAAHDSAGKAKADEEASFNGNSIEATAEAVDKYVDAFSHTPKIGDQDPALRVSINANIAMHGPNGGFAGSLASASAVDVVLGDGAEFTLRGGKTPIRIANSDELKNVPVPVDIAAFTKNTFPSIEEILFLRPTGYVHDEFIGTFLMAHVTKVALTVRNPVSQDKKVWVIESKRSPEPYAPLADQRTAADFDIIGVKAGASPDDVRAAVEKEVGQTLTFDEKTMILSSPAPNCDFAYVSSKTPPGRKCFKGEFQVTEKGLLSSKLGLARAIYRQAVYRQSAGDLPALLTKKYGEPVYKAQINDNHGGLTVTSGSIIETFMEWGKRMGADRQGMVTPGVHVPVHALEAELQVGGDMALLTMTLTDRAFADKANADAAAAAAAKKADEQRKKAADVKL